MYISVFSTLALVYTAKFGQLKIRKIRDAIPSVNGLFEKLKKNPNDTALGMVTRCAVKLILNRLL